MRKMRKTIIALLAGLLLVALPAAAQRGMGNLEARKLQMALYAVSHLYVDSTSETKLV